MKENQILMGYEYAKACYADVGVDVDAAINKVDSIPISMHCWQGDDVIGFDGSGSLTGGIATTGNYPGRARTPEELRSDIDFARTLIPGALKLNLHACYAEKGGKQVDRDEYTPDLFQNWIDWAKQNGIGLDFNPTFFSHPMMDGDFSLASRDEKKRRFWIEHGKRCREIGLAMAQQTGFPCVVDYWMPDGTKDTCVDTVYPRKLMTEALDEIFASDISTKLVPCAVESKLFGMGLESYTVASHEYALCYALSRGLTYCLDSGHFHPTELISAKLSAVFAFLDTILLHVSRGVRWDSDHVVAFDDELQRIMDEIVFNDFSGRTFIALDFFDASINRIACWAIGTRNARKALLNASLAPITTLRDAEACGDNTTRFALLEERKSMPAGAVWDYYCLTKGFPVGRDWLDSVKRYEAETLQKRI